MKKQTPDEQNIDLAQLFGLDSDDPELSNDLAPQILLGADIVSGHIDAIAHFGNILLETLSEKDRAASIKFTEEVTDFIKAKIENKEADVNMIIVASIVVLVATTQLGFEDVANRYTGRV